MHSSVLGARLDDLQCEQRDYELSVLHNEALKKKSTPKKTAGPAVVVLLHCDLLLNNNQNDIPTTLLIYEHVVRAFGNTLTPLTLLTTGYTIELLQKHRPGLIEYLPSVSPWISFAASTYVPMAATLYPYEALTSAQYDGYSKADASLEVSTLGYLANLESCEILLPGLRALGWGAILVPEGNNRLAATSDDVWMCPVSSSLTSILRQVMTADISPSSAASLFVGDILFVPLDVTDFTEDYYPEEVRRLLTFLSPGAGLLRAVAFSRDLLPPVTETCPRRSGDVFVPTSVGRDTLGTFDRLRRVAPSSLSKYQRRLWQLAARCDHATAPTKATTALVGALLEVVEGGDHANIDTLLSVRESEVGGWDPALGMLMRSLHETLSRYRQNV